MKATSIYRNIKIVFYLLGLSLTVFSISKYGLVDSHTPPLGFITPFLFMLLGFIWMIVDWIVSYSSDTIKINFTVNYLGVVLNFIIVVVILIDAI